MMQKKFIKIRYKFSSNADREKQPINASDVACLSITNQRETIVVFERDTGKPLHRAIVWQCRRGDPFCQQLIADGHEASVHQKTGLKNRYLLPRI